MGQKEVLESFPDQCEGALNLGGGIEVGDVNKIVVAAMGGSAFSGDVLKAIAGGDIDVVCNKNYNLPKDAGENTLVFAVSYSGNTEETLSALQDAVKKKCRIIGIGSGGQLEKKCKENNTAFIKVPSGIQPRHATGYLTIPMINVLQENGIITNQNIELMIKEIKNREIPEKGKEISELLYKKIPIIYSSERLACVSLGWKIRLNEDAKMHAFANQFPEVNHNEMLGYVKKIANFHTLIIRDEEDHKRIKKRFVVTKKIIENLGGECTIIDTFGSNLISRIFSAIYTAGWASYYLALKYGVDPEDIGLVEEFKKELDK